MAVTRRPSASRRPESAWIPAWIIACVFLVVCALAGGSSRPDAYQLLLLRPVTIICLGLLLILARGIAAPWVRPLYALLGLFALSMAIQLIPLPPGIWFGLPGHGRFAAGLRLVGADDVWRPISLIPDLTLNSLVALLPVAFTLAAVSAITSEQRRWLVGVPILIAAVSAAVGLIQISGGTDSFAYFYRPTSDALPVGLFANRNHQAVMLAIALPALAVWTRMPASTTSHERLRLAIAAVLGLMLVPLILVTGSRAGMVFGVLGLAAAFLLSRRPSKGRQPKRTRLAVLALWALPVVMVVVVILAGRAFSLDRIAGMSGAEADLRVTATPIVLRIVRDFLPFGTGYGVFDTVFRSYEPDSFLHLSYYNRAHNDILETVMAGGVLGAVVLILFAIWWGRRAYAVVVHRRADPDGLLAQLGVVVGVMLGAASIVDYPLRTPIGAVVFTIACCWMARGAAGSQGAPATPSVAIARPGR